MRLQPLPLLATLVLAGNATPCRLAAQVASPEPARHHLDLGIALRAGTPGIGLEVSKLLVSHLALRAGANYFKLTTTSSKSSINYDASLKFHGASGVLDLYPSARGSFHFTAGVMTNPATVDATGKPEASDSFKINDVKYSASQVGTLKGKAKFPGMRPYVGLGFGTPARGRHPLSFLFDLGAVLGKAKVTLDATGAASIPGLASDLQAQRAKTQKDVDKYAKLFPVISFGLAYRL